MSERLSSTKYVRLAARAMLESELQENVRSAFVADGWRYFHTYRSERSPAGFPDVIALKDGRIIFAELKREGKSPTKEQQAWLDEAAKVEAAETYVWRPSDWLNGSIAKIILRRSG